MTERLDIRKPPLILICALLLAACSRRPVAPEHHADAAAGAPVTFVNKVWTVSRSSSVALGQLYVFLSEGTLVIASSHGKPSLGTWKYEGGVLTMVEEGLPYRTDILKLTGDEFRIRSNNPGEPVEITLVPAEAPPLSN